MTLQQIEVFIEQVGAQVKQDRRDHLLLRRAAREPLKGFKQFLQEFDHGR
ncbi:hypothetical protein R5H17_010430 [Pseudomonas aeruginosa]|jgi:hypothetical protein|nr:hypothetical protein [Pseudomonas aeruginosa]ERW72437.1 hypothetical protein Q026_01186 [Pseudomonas aeruginosa BWHPSA013]MBH4373788.1 hypothetical protein [Pseudomonas aeruginosa]MDN3765151.1 hypothetical protein [Pseudomonas aeruginosa]MDW2962973.1 hypothetical protein [Pseudomonas aeruginosa]HBP5301073.1 hypothetical protein [Pseudomonas aeruginosa]